MTGHGHFQRGRLIEGKQTTIIKHLIPERLKLSEDIGLSSSANFDKENPIGNDKAETIAIPDAEAADAVMSSPTSW